MNKKRILFGSIGLLVLCVLLAVVCSVVWVIIEQSRSVASNSSQSPVVSAPVSAPSDNSDSSTQQSKVYKGQFEVKDPGVLKNIELVVPAGSETIEGDSLYGLQSLWVKGDNFDFIFSLHYEGFGLYLPRDEFTEIEYPNPYGNKYAYMYSREKYVGVFEKVFQGYKSRFLKVVDYVSTEGSAICNEEIKESFKSGFADRACNLGEPVVMVMDVASYGDADVEGTFSLTNSRCFFDDPAGLDSCHKIFKSIKISDAD